MFHIVFHNAIDAERCPIGYDSKQKAHEAGMRGISVGAGWTGFHIV